MRGTFARQSVHVGSGPDWSFGFLDLGLGFRFKCPRFFIGGMERK